MNGKTEEITIKNVKQEKKEEEKVMKEKKSEMATAYHEAGHAVVALRTHYAPKPKKISIIPIPDERILSEVSYYKRMFDENGYFQPVEEKRIQCSIMSLFAGEIAEKKFTGRNDHVGSQTDFDNAIKYGELLYTTGLLGDLFDWLSVLTEAIVNKYWHEIEKVAEVLLEKKTLSGKELKEIIISTMTGPEINVTT